jgi:hypothetical protein
MVELMVNNILTLAYMSSNCHVEIICEERAEKVKKEKTEKKEDSKIRNVKVHIRKAHANHLKNKKYVEVGGKK